MDNLCREFCGYRNTNGYGMRSGKARQRFGTSLVHRQVWIMANGPIPARMEICHHCDNPACFRLDHLFLGSRRDNALDAVAKGRHGRGNRPRREVCKLGHPITGEGHDRLCRTCLRAANRDRMRRWRAAKRGENL